MLFSHVKISLLLWIHNKLRLLQEKTVSVKWFGITLVFIQQIKHYMAAWRYEISLVLKIFHSFAALTCEIFSNTRREILYLHAAM